MVEVCICVGSSCHLKGSYQVIKTFQELIKEKGLEDKIQLKASFCLGRCTKGVAATVAGESIEDLTISNVAEKFNAIVNMRL